MEPFIVSFCEDDESGIPKIDPFTTKDTLAEAEDAARAKMKAEGAEDIEVEKDENGFERAFGFVGQKSVGTFIHKDE